MVAIVFVAAVYPDRVGGREVRHLKGELLARLSDEGGIAGLARSLNIKPVSDEFNEHVDGLAIAGLPLMIFNVASDKVLYPCISR